MFPEWKAPLVADPTFPIFGLLKAIAEGLDTRPIRRRHGDYLHEHVELRTGDRVTDRDVTLRRATLTINLPEKVRRRFTQLHKKKHPRRRAPNLTPVQVHLTKVVKMRVRWPRFIMPGYIVIDAPGCNDKWRSKWFERPHRIPIRSGHRRQRRTAQIVSAIWYLRPDLLSPDEVVQAATRVTGAADHRWRIPIGRREVVMSQQTGNRTRRAAPVHPSQEWTHPAQEVTSRGWGGQEVRWRRG